MATVALTTHRAAAPPCTPPPIAALRGLVTLLLEVEAGRRPRRHLIGLTTPALYAQLAETWTRGGPPGVAVSVRGWVTSASRYDAVALVRRRKRMGAIALGLLRTPRGWILHDVGRPEDGPRATAAALQQIGAEDGPPYTVHWHRPELPGMRTGAAA